MSLSVQGPGPDYSMVVLKHEQVRQSLSKRPAMAEKCPGAVLPCIREVGPWLPSSQPGKEKCRVPVRAEGDTESLLWL